MNEEVRQLFGQGTLARLGLAEGGVRRDDHIPQQMRVKLRERSFTHGEGQHVSRLVHASIACVESVHARVIDDDHTRITGLTFEGFEQPLQCLFEVPRVYRNILLVIPTTDGHSCFAYGVSPLLIRQRGIQHGGGRWQ
jgi:hypothetical protein